MIVCSVLGAFKVAVLIHKYTSNDCVQIAMNSWNEYADTYTYCRDVCHNSSSVALNGSIRAVISIWTSRNLEI